jgi:hypothetical protein
MLIFSSLSIAKTYFWSDPHLFNPVDGFASSGLASNGTLWSLGRQLHPSTPCHTFETSFWSSDSGVQNGTLDPYEVHWFLGNNCVHPLEQTCDCLSQRNGSKDYPWGSYCGGCSTCSDGLQQPKSLGCYLPHVIRTRSASPMFESMSFSEWMFVVMLNAWFGSLLSVWWVEGLSTII